MQIVIDIPEELYKRLTAVRGEYYLEDGEDLCEAVQHGTPLPKGHGRLIDRKKISSIRLRGITEYCIGYNTRTDEVDKDIANALVIVEADKENENGI